VATYNKFEATVEHLVIKTHDLLGTSGSDADALKAYLSNAAPSAAADAVKTDMAEITNQNGYAAPVGLDNVGSRTGGTVTVTAKSFTVTAAGGSVGPFQYVVVYNDTATAPADALICWFDYGSPLTLADGESLTVKFNGANVGSNGTLFTLA
jgi:hypothetical protein